MKVHTQPKVILVTRPSLAYAGVGQLLGEYGEGLEGWQQGEHDAEGDQIPELMGRLCYGSFGKDQGRVGSATYLANILKAGHGSVLEHANWGFVACRISRSTATQMVRHRAGFAFSGESQHFIRYSKDGRSGTKEAAICLTGLEGDELNQAVTDCGEAVEKYGSMWERIRIRFPEGSKGKKQASEAARGLLPGAMECRLGFTANARALRHFCELRGTVDNIVEIRHVAGQVAAMMLREAPAIFQDVRVVIDADGHPLVTSDHRKV